MADKLEGKTFFNEQNPVSLSCIGGLPREIMSLVSKIFIKNFFPSVNRLQDVCIKTSIRVITKYH